MTPKFWLSIFLSSCYIFPRQIKISCIWCVSLLVTCLLENIWKLRGEVTCWTLLGVKRLKEYQMPYLIINEGSWNSLTALHNLHLLKLWYHLINWNEHCTQFCSDQQNVCGVSIEIVFLLKKQQWGRRYAFKHNYQYILNFQQA